MIDANAALIVFVPLAYLSALFAYSWNIDSDRRLGRGAPLRLALAALLLHGALIGVRWAMIRQVPLTTIYDSLSALAFCMTLVYVMVEALTRIDSTGFDVLVIPFLVTTGSLAFGPHEPQPNAALATRFFALHTIPAVGGLATILVSGVFGILYLRLAKAIQKKDFEGLFRRLPDLEILAQMNFRSASIGLALMTMAIGWGATWYGELFEKVRITEPKIFITLLLWSVLLVPVVGKLLRRISDRATAVVAVITMALVVVSIVVSFLPLIGFHRH